MTIRITTQMTSNLMTKGINKNYADVFKTYQQITSGKKFTEMSENPTDGSKILKYNKQLDQLGDWSKNIATANDELNMAYDTLSLVNDNLTRINDLVIQASNSANSEESIAALKQEIEARTLSIAQLANTKYQDKYLFAGSNTTQIPYIVDEETMSAEYKGTPSDGSWGRNIEISEGVTIPTNVNGEDVFGDGTTGIFATLKEISDAMQEGAIDFDKIRASLDPLQEGIRKVVSNQASITSRVQKLEATSSINSDVTLGLTERKSNLQDTDLVEAASNLSRYQMALQASMQAGTSILNSTSLLDFI